ncbi:fumarylacetoacetate hydrolase family protein [Rhodococcus ruber]|uniref:Fumarylacetoacetate hydrolase family protein n=1 Tax=Rhodococcus ruber TaxID=1830 RepID=A0ABT4M7J3_9NOCA|nr:fumarylacetoacetate hydrolase family protein [Rhodococcus ruber]MCZ4516913.1 fumarylacetoacetate hydrolase family protein [Rhodococcus ruber]
MLLVSYSDGREARLGAVSGEVVVDLARANEVFEPTAVRPEFSSMVPFFESGPRGLEAGQRLVESALAEGSETTTRQLQPVTRTLADVQLLSPVPRPRRVRDYLTHIDHYTGSFGRDAPPPLLQFPVSYNCNHEAIYGPEDTIPWPAYSDQLDFELELGFFVAKGGRNISAKSAASHIAGISIFNDVSARDIQVFEMSAQTGPAKGKNFANVIGPGVLTFDEVNVDELAVTARVNGEVWASGAAGAASYSFEEVLAWSSYCEDVVPGEFIATGTVGGGCGLEQGRWMNQGDVVELEAEGIGVLRNRIGVREIVPADAGLPTYELYPPRFGSA